ncbi:hypothetical protein [Accumulibacter sp.]|nr:hypothetical protein [Accumulibacter sp.]MCP5229609.1 hypothetical protein [Accumulibacter sp.]
MIAGHRKRQPEEIDLQLRHAAPQNNSLLPLNNARIRLTQIKAEANLPP